MNGEETTILYLTDSVLDPYLADKCREYLVWAANGRRIVSVSQEPLEFGDNVCVGRIGRSALSIDLQMKEGLSVVHTPFVAVAEHDCIYSPEHFNFVPPDDAHFWYNDNCWLVQYRNSTYPQYNGMYSYFGKRRVQSQLICGTEVFKRATEKKLKVQADVAWREKNPGRTRIGEPGGMALERAWKITRNPRTLHLWNDLKDYITSYNAKDWRTRTPNLDIRHGDNHTGQRRGHNRTWDLPPWGRFEDVLNLYAG